MLSIIVALLSRAQVPEIWYFDSRPAAHETNAVNLYRMDRRGKTQLVTNAGSTLVKDPIAGFAPHLAWNSVNRCPTWSTTGFTEQVNSFYTLDLKTRKDRSVELASNKFLSPSGRSTLEFDVKQDDLSQITVSGPKTKQTIAANQFAKECRGPAPQPAVISVRWSPSERRLAIALYSSHQQQPDSSDPGCQLYTIDLQSGKLTYLGRGYVGFWMNEDVVVRVAPAFEISETNQPASGTYSFVQGWDKRTARSRFSEEFIDSYKDHVAFTDPQRNGFWIALIHGKSLRKWRYVPLNFSPSVTEFGALGLVTFRKDMRA